MEEKFDFEEAFREAECTVNMGVILKLDTEYYKINTGTTILLNEQIVYSKNENIEIIKKQLIKQV